MQSRGERNLFDVMPLTPTPKIKVVRLSVLQMAFRDLDPHYVQ